MDLKNYQDECTRHLTPGKSNFAFAVSKLVGETGRFSWAISKALEHNAVFIHNNDLLSLSDERQYNANMECALKNRIGAILFCLAEVCTVLGWSLDDIANANLDRKSK